MQISSMKEEERGESYCIETTIVFEEVAKKLDNWHYESAKSALNILHAVYFDWLKGGNRLFILSKSHSSLALYSVFIELGYISFADLDNSQSRIRICNRIQKVKVSQRLMVSTGSLGQALSIAAGISFD